MTRTLHRHFGRAVRWGIAFALTIATVAPAIAQQTGLRIINTSDRKTRGGIPGLSATARVMPLSVDLRTLRTVRGPELRVSSLPLAAGVTVDLELDEFSILTSRATVTTTGDQGVELLTGLTARLFRGRVAGDPNSRAYLAIGQYDIAGMITVNGRTYQLQTDHTVRKTSDDLPALCYATAENHGNRFTCGVDESNEFALGGSRISKEIYQSLLGAVPITVNFMVPGAIEGDYEFRQLFKDEADPNVAAADYVMIIVGQASAIYERDMNCQLQVAYMNIYTSAGSQPYSESGSMQLALYQERDFWRANRGSVQRAYAHVFSGKGWTNPIGIAFLSVLCDPNQAFAYSLITRLGTEQDVTVVSHENGHMFGSVHTHSCSWNPAIDSCAAAENGSCYGSSSVHESRGTIMSYCAAKDMAFHPKCAQVIRNRLASASAPCVLPGKKLEIGPHLTVIPKVNVNIDRDTLIRDFYRNPSVSPVDVTELRITGINSERFSIVEGAPPFTLGPGETKDLLVRYNSPVEEPSFGTFTAIHDGYNPPPKVYFEAYAVDPRPDLGIRIDPVQRDIHFGTIRLGEQIDTTLSRIFYNAGSATVQADSSWIGGPDAFDFQMTEGNAPFTIPTGNTNLSARFLFKPKDIGQKEAWLYIAHNSRTRQLDSIRLTGTVKRGPLLVISISNLTVNFGEREKRRLYDTAFPGFFYNAGSDTLGLVVDLYGDNETSFTSDVSGISELAPGSSLSLGVGLFDTTDGIKRAYLVLGHIRFDTLSGIDQLYRRDTVWLIALVGNWASAPGTVHASAGIAIAPNPTQGPISAAIAPLDGEQGEEVTIRLVDILGREVDRVTERFGVDPILLRINSDGVPDGLYHLVVETERFRRVGRVTLQR